MLGMLGIYIYYTKVNEYILNRFYIFFFIICTSYSCPTNPIPIITPPTIPSVAGASSSPQP